MRKIGVEMVHSKFWRDVRGAAGIEFGMLFPVLLLLLLGTIELSRAIDASRHFSAAVATASDIVAREEYLGTSKESADGNIKGILESMEYLMKPYDSSDLKLAVLSVRASAEDASKGKVDWSYSLNNDDVRASCSDYALPKDIVSPGGSVIIVEGSNTYKPLFGSYVLNKALEWTSKSYHIPRNSCVDYVKGDNCIAAC